MGRNDGHQRGDSVAAYGELFMATVILPNSGIEGRGFPEGAGSFDMLKA
jgi:hypothetical protein